MQSDLKEFLGETITMAVVHRSRLGMWGRDFDWYRLRLLDSTLIPLMYIGRIWHNLALKLRPSGGRQSKSLVCYVLGSHQIFPDINPDLSPYLRLSLPIIASRGFKAT